MPLRGTAPDGFDAVSVQNVGSTYIIVSRDVPAHSNGILINFSLYCNGALYVICWTGLPVTPTGTALQLECGVGRHQCCSQPAQHEDSPPGRPPDPESDTNDIVISLFINKIINPDKSFGSSSMEVAGLVAHLVKVMEQVVKVTALSTHGSCFHCGLNEEAENESEVASATFSMILMSHFCSRALVFLRRSWKAFFMPALSLLVLHWLGRPAPDGFDAVSVQNVGSTYIIVSRDVPAHSNGILINFSLYCNGALYVICWTGLPVTPTGTALQLECGVGRHQCCSQPAQHEDSPPGRPPDPESDTNDIVISLFINKIINPDKSFGSSSKEHFEKMVGDIGHYANMASQILQTHTDHEIVALGGLIPTELQATLKRVQTISLTPNQHSNITASVKTDDLVTQLSKLGEIIVFSPSPSSSTWMSTSVARVGTRYHIKVQSKTSKGEEYPHGGVEVKGEMRSKTHNGAVVYGEVEDHRDGTYTITLTPQTAGPHQLLITMDGQHVQNSPNDFDVRPKRDYHTLCNAQLVIQCNRPYCVAIHDNGDIYVGSADHCIYVFDQTGQLKNTIGSSGNGDGQFSSPYGISIKGDVLYVADSGNHRVQKLTSSGKFLHKFGQQGSGQGQFNGPVGVIIDSNNKLIVSDCNNHRIQIFNENGGWLLTIHGKGSGNHSFRSPWGLALDPQGNIHVAAFGSNVIKVFSKEGVYVRMYGDPNGPRGLAIDGEGYSLVSENSGHCLSIYDPEGNKIHTVGNLKYPWGTALDPRDGSVFIANYGANTGTNDSQLWDSAFAAQAFLEGTNGSQLWDSAFAAQAFLEVHTKQGLVIVCHVTDTPLSREQKSEMKQYPRNVQRDDGGWGLYTEGKSTVFGTALNYVTMRLLGVARDDPDVAQARTLLHHLGDSVHDLCALMEKIHKTQGTDKKKKILSSFIERWRASHQRDQDGSYHGADVDGDWTHSKVPQCDDLYAVDNISWVGGRRSEGLESQCGVGGRKTDTFFAIMRLLLSELDRARPAYGMKETALAKHYIEYLDDLANGNTSKDRAGMKKALQLLLRNTSALEQKWLIRIILKSSGSA
eukprot:Em0004g744a